MADACKQRADPEASHKGCELDLADGERLEGRLNGRKPSRVGGVTKDLDTAAQLRLAHGVSLERREEGARQFEAVANLRLTQALRDQTPDGVLFVGECFRGARSPLGDTGDGNTGVPSDEQGISNRPGDQPDG